jgi:hypothetical protein
MRLINRALAALLALALVVVGFLVVIEVVTHWFSDTAAIVHWHNAYSWAGRTTWKQGSVRVSCIVLAVLGLILLVAQLKPAKISRLPADPEQAGAQGIDTAYTRRGAAASIRAAVADVDGIRGAAVTVGRRRVRIEATSSARDRVTAQTMGLRAAPSLSVRISPRSR